VRPAFLHQDALELVLRFVPLSDLANCAIVTKLWCAASRAVIKRHRTRRNTRWEQYQTGGPAPQASPLPLGFYHSITAPGTVAATLCDHDDPAVHAYVCDFRPAEACWSTRCWSPRRWCAAATSS
jgi:hypothetical protein